MEPRTLGELVIRAQYVLVLPHKDRKVFIEIARTKSPSAAFDLATREAIINDVLPLAAAKATRWLAMIRRDHGEEVFDRIVAER